MNESRQAWLVRDGEVLASLEIPVSHRDRARGLLGRDGLTGAMLFERTRSVHTFKMKFDLDVAVLDSDGVVLKTLILRKNRVVAPMVHGRAILEAEAGAFSFWELHIGDVLEVSEEAQ